MAGKVLTLHGEHARDNKAEQISHMWDKWYNAKAGFMELHTELQSYITATSTATTSASRLPWKNTTTVPKLTQIRDNLHSNYISSLFPNDDWLRWEAYTADAATKEKKQAIEQYISNKTRRANFRETVSKLLYDYIDYGNAFAYTDYVNHYKTDEDGSRQVIYSGPVIRRIHPYDIVFNPLAPSFEESPVIVRSITSVGELKLDAERSATPTENMDAIERAISLRENLGSLSPQDVRKYRGMMMDGFGSYYEYLQSDEVEVLTFMGDLYNKDTGELEKDKKIVILDRSFVLEDDIIPGWLGRNVFHVGWRTRSDSLWAMGPLDNLVGMQYRLDHLENLKSDAMDLNVFPIFKVKGNVDEFDWGPLEEIHMDENGDVELLRPDASVLQVNLEINNIMDKMELMAGAPREAMGMRTPGEKTAFEVQQLTTAAGRIFQEKITTFEIGVLEKALNSMLEQARRNLDAVDVIRTVNKDYGASVFLDITKDDIAGDGLLRPIGARHFGEQSIMMQDLSGIMNGALGEKLSPHLSGVALASLVEDTMGLERYSLFRPNVGVVEATQTQSMAHQGQQKLMDTATVPR